MFVVVCDQSFPRSISADAFISLLVALDNTQEVQDYIKSYLGETRDAQTFAKQFLEKRQKLKTSQPPQAPLSSSVSCKKRLITLTGEVNNSK